MENEGKGGKIDERQPATSFPSTEQNEENKKYKRCAAIGFIFILIIFVIVFAFMREYLDYSLSFRFFKHFLLVTPYIIPKTPHTSSPPPLIHVTNETSTVGYNETVSYNTTTWNKNFPPNF